ncbi:hypothetical protein SLINC_5251 [Streptomyces lincolnensis]|uniref:Uncharacterized protein n=1 Tax=Streptomyces lincolnensis TaxID=1915 RepID=A0A1B1MFR6_STRLN|nr:hypothetical protein [Streptomyces lincolnensis]ANS67475.1 hypothetical protein SLINC_5251 [Streptomyces lincolnensis]AXG54790.1 hypothetical protein SLCG_3635 [Streptomyces lincolnensis]QMV09142.1 hypothetical protein GJU35_28210 [Streptomyces lincolnensis]
MADERCDFPGDTPRTPGRWLNRETAELLLSGASLEAVDAADRDQAERLAKTLDSLSVEPPPGAELPGEAAALAAFRKVRADRADDWIGVPAPGHRTRVPSSDSSDAGLVRIGDPADRADDPRPRRGRALRLGLAAALTVGMVGGVAAAVGIGFLPGVGDSEPDPAATVSAAATPNRPFVSPSPPAAHSEPRPDGAENDTGRQPPRDTAREGSAPPGTGTGSEGRSKQPGAWRGAPSACRDVRDGKNLNADRRRTLEGAAGGPSQVKDYCKGLLAAPNSADGSTGRSDTDVRNGVRKDGRGDDEGGDKGRGRGRGGDGHRDDRERDDRDRGRGESDGYGGRHLGHGRVGFGVNSGAAPLKSLAKDPSELRFSRTSNFFAGRV